MTIHIRDNDQTASTAEPELETPPDQDPDPMRSPVAETDADVEMHAEVASDDETDVEVEADDEIGAEVASRAQVPEPDADTGSEDEAHLELNTGAYGRSEPEPEPEPEAEGGSETGSEDEPHLELETGAYGRPGFGADMYDAPASDTELVSEAAIAVGEPETLDVVDEVDLRVAPVEVATEAGAVLDDAGGYGERWNALQTSFVDEPRQAVESADHLVTEAMEQLAKALASQRDSLQAQWRQGDEVDTEQLRVAFQGYRAFLFGLLPT